MAGERPHSSFHRFKRDWDEYEEELNLSALSIRPSAVKGFDKLATETVVKILSYVPHDDFRNVRLVCRRFNEVSKTESLWKKVSFLDFSSWIKFQN